MFRKEIRLFGDYWVDFFMKVLLVLLLLASAALASSEIYVREYPGGHRDYSDKPSPGLKKLKLRSGKSYRIVQFVYDGDTLLLDNGDKVRLSGINTPEVESSRKRGESGGEQARIWMKEAIEGKKVRLEQDVERRDRYQRILAHVFTEDRTHINRALVSLGLATVNLYPPNLKYAEPLLDAQKLAEQRRLGIWGDPVYTPEPVENLAGSQRRAWGRFVGRARSIKPGGRFYRLIFSDRVDARIPRANLDLFPDLNGYLESELEIRGWPSRRKDHYSILVRHPSDLRAVAVE
ncbi:MAG: thermonuclease family protein [Methylococcales bacterium]